MPFTTYNEGLKIAQDTASRAISIESSLSSLPPTASALPTLLRAFPLYISSAESYSHLLASSLVPTSERAAVQKKWRLVLERAEKVKKKVEELGGAVGRAEVSEDGEEGAVKRRGGKLNGLDLGSWECTKEGKVWDAGVRREVKGRPDREFEGAVWRDAAQPSMGELDAEWAEASEASWRADERGIESGTTSGGGGAASIKEQTTRWLARQGPGADCSISAAMTVCLEHNRRFGTSLAREALYPQARAVGLLPAPRRSENGKHVVRLMINGLWRAVEIDSLLPFSPSSQRPLHITSFPFPLSLSNLSSSPTLPQPTSTSVSTSPTSRFSPSDTTSGPAWLPLSTKAYFKALGGYDIPGSDPSPDVYAFTGWIPERISLRHGFQREKEWSRVCKAWQMGRVMVTLGTGESVDEDSGVGGTVGRGEGKGEGKAGGEGMIDGENSKVQLVPLHAYAVTDMRVEGDQRILEIYDPGTSKMQYDSINSRLSSLGIHNGQTRPGVHSSSARGGEGGSNIGADDKAAVSPAGLFTMSWDQVCNRFDTFNLNWDPESFPVTVERHWSWPKPLAAGEVSTFGASPRYRLRVKSTPGSEVWVLLSQHMVNRDRRLDDVALRVVRVYGPGNHPMVLQIAPASRGSPYTNALHTLVRRDLRDAECVYDVLPVRDGGDFQTGFTLRAFASLGAELTLERIRTSLPFVQTVPSTLTKRNAGGNPGYPTHHHNPQYKLTIRRPSVGPGSPLDAVSAAVGKATVRVSLCGAAEVPWNVRVMWGKGELVIDPAEDDVVCNSGAYSYGMAFAEEVNIQPGDYTIIVSCFEPGQVGQFSLSVESSAPVSITEIPAEGAGLFSRAITGRWDEMSAGGRPSASKYHLNPKLELILPAPATVFARLSLPTPASIPINLSIFRRDIGGALGDLVATSGPYIDRTAGVVVPRSTLQAGVYVVVPSTYEHGVETTWGVSMWSSGVMSLEKV